MPDSDPSELGDTTRVTGQPPSDVAWAVRPEWQGTARYEVVRLLGEGGMGAVYEVFDRETQRVVALKTLLQSNPASVYRFKKEFRTLADVQHRNLVQLYEFVATESGDVFFTMELVRGTDFLRYVRGPEGKLDIGRLRAALRELVEGVLALHSAGQLHRDIKPANVLVTSEGRVVLLDFGVAAEMSVQSGRAEDEVEVVGTVPYMAPEQALSKVPRPACDWYSVGVVLYAALVGSHPFVGSAAEIVQQKIALDPVPPARRVPDVPPDLDSLCLSLLARDPDLRPSGTDILRRLGGAPDDQGKVVRAPVTTPTALVGRGSHLSSLARALQATDAGGHVTVFVAGLSGMGKSALIHHFLDEQALRPGVVVLRGRAYERESVPFKAVDAVIDALSLYLVRRARGGDPVQLPADVGVLATVFPVLGRVGGVTAQIEGTVPEPMRVRRRAFAALRELLASAAAGQRLIVYVDDAQWGDVDSAALLLELLRPPAEAPLLLIVSYREDESQRSAFLLEMRARLPERVDVRELAVGPLSNDDSECLAMALLGEDERARSVARAVARESGGSPFLVEELVGSLPGTRRADLSVAHADLSAVTIEQMVSDRARQLPGDARLLLEMIAVEGRPVPVTRAASAAGIDGRVDELMGLLRSRRFVRGGLRDGHEVVEMSHDRIRETVVAQLSSEATRSHHARWAQMLESSPDGNPEMIAVHWLGAGQPERGARFAEAAAEHATQKLAFDRAVQLFRTAAAAVPASSSDGQRLRLRLAQVLEWAGRGTEAARVYEAVARVAPPMERAALERAAAEQLLTCGRIDEGAAVLHRVLSEVNLRAPRTALSALFWLLVYRGWLRLRGLRFVSRSLGDIRERDRLRLDALYTVALGFGSIDVVLSACMTAWYLLAALRVGERGAIQRAATLQMSLVSAGGGTEGAHEVELERMARVLVETDRQPEARAFFRSNIGVSHYCRGRWNAAVEVLDTVLQEFPANRAGMTSNVNVFCVCSLVYAGRIRELRRRLPRLIADAEDRGDLFMLAHMRASHPIIAWLADDDLDGARRHAREGMARWPRVRYVIQDWQAMLAEAQIALYAGEGASAYERAERDAPALGRSLLLQAQIIRGLTDFVRGRAAIASVESAPALRDERLRGAATIARRLGRERMPWTTLLSLMLAAAAENARGDVEAAVASLRACVEAAKVAEMSMHGAAAARQLGALVGGDEGASMIAEADAAMLAEDISAPARWAAMLLPGRWGRT